MIQQIRFRAMGCQVLAIVDDMSERTAQALARVPDWFEEWEQSLSRFREDSELSQLNRAQGKPFLASPTLWEMVRLAFLAARDTNGLVTPAILPALLNAGYSADFDRIKNHQQSLTPGRFTAEMNLQEVFLDQAERIITLPAEMRLDFGGTAKGWAAQRAANRLRAFGPSLVNVGGDLFVSGQLQDGSAWPIGISDPFNPEQNLQQIAVRFGGVATSGKDYRKWVVNGQTNHHIIDPRTLRPADTDVLNVTVIAPSPLQAEVAAKVILILGSEQGLAWLQQKEDHAALLTTDEHLVKMTRNFQPYLAYRPHHAESRAAAGLAPETEPAVSAYHS